MAVKREDFWSDDLGLAPVVVEIDTPETSWTPVNLNTLPDKPPVRPTLGGSQLLYPGKRHVFSGPPESAKTLAAYALLILVVRGGGLGVLIDFEMGGYEARDRLRELGASPEEVSRILYVEPDIPATRDLLEPFVRASPDLVVVDAAVGAYSLQGLDDNKRGDVEQIANLYVRDFWKAGVATITLDHVVKNVENRGRFQIGSERKLGGADVHLGFEPVKAISRGGSGLYKVITHKDRGGYLKRGHLADLTLESDPETHAIAWTFATPSDDSAEGYWRPTHLMERVSIDLELRSEPVSRNTVATTIGGTKDYVLKAINALVIEGFVTETDGPNRSKLVASTRRYRENDPVDNPEKPSGGSVVLCGSAVVREPLWFGGSGGSSPYGDDTTDHHHADHDEQGRWFEQLTAPPEPIDPDSDIPF